MPKDHIFTQTYAALKIQYFWQSVKVKAGLSSANNHHYYLQLLSMMNVDNPFYTLAVMMYGRVISTPQNEFPGLQERNPYVGKMATYHRLDDDHSPVLLIILKQWGHVVSTNHYYIPLINSAIGTIEAGLKALNLTDKQYELITIPTERYPVRYLKILKIPKLTSENDNFVQYNRCLQLGNLGLVASPWVLSIVATFGNFRHQSPPPITCDRMTQNALIRQPTTMSDLTNSVAYMKLTAAHPSLLSSALLCLLAGIPHDVNSAENIQRISLFLETAVILHPYDHPHLPRLVYAIIHEISLLLIQSVIKNKVPYINFHEYQALTKNEAQKLLQIDGGCYIALPAHSGSHANLIAATLAYDICQAHFPRDSVKVTQVGYEYWEVGVNGHEYTWIGTPSENGEAHVVRISAGVIGDYGKGTFPAADLNQTIREESCTNAELEVMIIDITSADYNTLRLAPDVIDLIKHRFITLIFWESVQKFGLLHTDQAQYGRVFAWYPGIEWPSTVQATQKHAEQDMCIPDVQIGAYIFKTCSELLPRIRTQHFNNGDILRESILGSLESSTHIIPSCNPFISLNAVNDANSNAISQVLAFFNHHNLSRDSFGHFYTTIAGQSRISAGAENLIDTIIFSLSLDYFEQHTFIEIYDKLITTGSTLNITNAKEIIHYLSLIKALHIHPDFRHCLLPMESINHCAKNIFNNNKKIRHLLNGSSQFMLDIHAFLNSTALSTSPAYTSNIPLMNEYGLFGNGLRHSPTKQNEKLLPENSACATDDLASAFY